MQNITISAPGKLFLFGEYAVLSGHPALLTAVDPRLTVRLSETEDNKISYDLGTVTNTRFIDAVISLFSQELTGKGIHISVSSPFSGKFGFGSSSAVTVALIVALDQYFSKAKLQQENLSFLSSADKVKLFQKAFKIVQHVQGNGSGADIATAIYGKTVWYEKGKPVEQLTVNWSTISLIVAYSGKKANTGDLIRELEKKKREFPEKFERILQSIGDLTQEAKKALQENDWKSVGKYMNFNQEYLRDLGVSTQKIEDMLLSAKNAGAWGAKISGAGGGDSIIVLVSPEKSHAVKQAIQKVGGEIVEVTVNADGVK